MTWLDSLKAHDNVETVSKEGNLIKITTKDNRHELLSLSNFNEKLTGKMLQTLLNTYKFDFLLCNKKNFFIDEDAIRLLNKNNISFGTGGDLFRLLHDKTTAYSDFIPKDAAYIMNNLGANFNVKSYSLMSNRKISVIRHDGRPINFVFINEYAITQERINEIYELYAPFDFVLAANPNAHWKDYTYRGQEVKIGLWAALFSFLANPKS
ncbi:MULTISPECIES: hypothetical protein [unclassified Acinetobacter]|jgi:hypothetical protein|uniref:hypothetical protein n=1 Tax=unclassified Acinetobacter TaxID=196816 RepID=UPI000A34E1A9|nr:hypothetical protein [Acinetobacter sp. ANC 4218]OTG70915.1 hypothetical protein B9T38_11450 [Acinetobacter sp. ANC 4218]